MARQGGGDGAESARPVLDGGGRAARRRSRTRDAVLDHLEKQRAFVSTTDVLQALAGELPRLSRGTVYRAIRLLEEDGLLDVVMHERGFPLYRRCSRPDRHAHLVCSTCRRVVELDPPPLDVVEAGARAAGCVEVSVAVLVRGVCAACRGREGWPA